MALEIETVEAENIEFSKADLVFNVTDKEDSHDEVLVFAEYGEESDLSDGQRISDVNDTVVVSTGQDSHTVDDFNPDTTHYFRSKAEAIDFSVESQVDLGFESEGFIKESNIYNNETGMDTTADSEFAMDKVSDSEIAMDAVSDSSVAMDAVSDSEVAMDKVSDKEMPMEKVMSKVMARSKFLDSSFILDSLWSKIEASDIFWQEGTANELEDAVITFPEDDGVIVLDIRVDSRDDVDGGEWFLEFDAENIAGDELVVSERLVENEFDADGRIRIQIDGTTEFEEVQPTHTEYRETSVSIPNSGTFEVKFIADRDGSFSGDDDSWRVKEVRFE